MAVRRTLSGILSFLLVYSLLWMVLPGTRPTAAAAEDGDVPPEMQARAEAVFTRIADALAPEYDIHGNYSIQVVREKVPNAWINRNNEISVSTGLMELLTTDDQLAGIIGHEIAHGTLGHIPHRINQSVWTVFAVLALGVVGGDSGQSDWGGLLHMRDLFLFAYSRDQEAEADLVGMRYAREAGYDPEGLVEALLLMDRKRRNLPPDSPWHDVYRTHPPIPQRVSNLRFVLTTDRVLETAPSAPALLTGPAAARAFADAEDAAIAFARALFSGDAEAAGELLLRSGGFSAKREDEVRIWIRDMGGVVDPGWAASSGKIVDDGATGAAPGFDETVVVRLVRFAAAGRPDAETVVGDVSNGDAFAGLASDGGASAGDAFDGYVANAAVSDGDASTGDGPVRAPASVSADEVPLGDVVVSPALSVTVRRSAAGWFVVSWELTGE